MFASPESIRAIQQRANDQLSIINKPTTNKKERNWQMKEQDAS
jgi:hypothetical protein